MMDSLRTFLALSAVCLLASHALLCLLQKLLIYWHIRKPSSLKEFLDLLNASVYELEVEAETLCQLGKPRPRIGSQARFSIKNLRQTDTENIILALSNSPFFKILDPSVLRSIAEILQREDPSEDGLQRDCIYQSEEGIQQLFVLPESNNVLYLKMDLQSCIDIPQGGRVIFSPSTLACVLLSMPLPEKFHCTMRASKCHSAFWSLPLSSLSKCLSHTWPDARRRLLQQYWSHLNDALLLVFVEWLNLDVMKFLDAAQFDAMLARETEQLAVEQLNASGGQRDFSIMSFYEKRPLYKRLALRILCDIAECDPSSHSILENELAIRFYPKGEAVTCRSAFLVLAGPLEALTHPTIHRQLQHSWQPRVSRQQLPGWIGLTQYFSHSNLPFGLSAAPNADGLVLAELPDSLMDRLFGSTNNTCCCGVSISTHFEAVTRYLLRHLNPQLFRHDILINHRRLHRGDHLVREGEPAETVEIIVSGRLRHRTVDLGRGDSVGLIECLQDMGKTLWSRDVVAVRESRSVSLPFDLTRSWVSQQHRLFIMDRVLSVMCYRELERQQRLANSIVHEGVTVSDDAVDDNDDVRRSGVNLSTGQPLVGFLIDTKSFNKPVLMRHLRSCLTAAHGNAARLVSEADVQEQFGRPVEELPDAALQIWLDELELRYPTLILICSERYTRWTRLLLGYLDCLVVFCDADAPAGSACETPSDTELFYSNMFGNRVYLAVFHPLTLCPVPQGTSMRFQRRRYLWTKRVYHIRCCAGYYKAASAAAITATSVGPAPNSDLARLVRLTTGGAVGVAFGNDAGAGGLSNLGALEALVEQSVAIDAVSGSGRGAVVAATWALHNGDLLATRAAVEALLAQVDSRLSRLSDLTLPLVSALTGAGLNSALRQLFGPRRQAEDLWLPCLTVSTDLVAGRPVVHTTGTLWRAVRASCSRVGDYPPVWEPHTGRLLVDGAHTDSLPVRALRQRHRTRRVIAVALEDQRRLRQGAYLVYGDSVSGWSELLRRMNPFRLAPLAPAAADIQAALVNLAGGCKVLKDNEGREDDDEKRWCLTIRPDRSFLADEDCSAGPPGAVERLLGYWAARRRLRGIDAKLLTTLHGSSQTF